MDNAYLGGAYLVNRYLDLIFKIEEQTAQQ